MSDEKRKTNVILGLLIGFVISFSMFVIGTTASIYKLNNEAEQEKTVREAGK